jgi:hypothetical protein
MRTFVVSMAAAWLLAGMAVANEACKPVTTCGPAGCETQCGHDYGCCPHCGAKMCCQRVCTTKEVKKIVWICHCEPFCAPLPGCPRDGDCCGENGGCCGPEQKAEAACNSCCGHDGNCGPCAREEAKRQVPPKCTKVRERKYLEKKEIVCKVPTYKCIPVCPNCGCGGEGCNGGCNACGGSEGGKIAPPKSEKAPAPVPAPAPAPAPGKTTLDAPMPPAMATSYVK